MEKSVSFFFESYAVALLSLSPEEISKFYQVPMAVYSDYGVTTVNNEEEVLAFWEQGVKPYARMNIAKAVPEVFNLEQLSEKVFIAKVHWTNYDSLNKNVGEETNFYILMQFSDGLKITGLVIMSSE